jgi:hypothetical protein
MGMERPARTLRGALVRSHEVTIRIEIKDGSSPSFGGEFEADQGAVAAAKVKAYFDVTAQHAKLRAAQGESQPSGMEPGRRPAAGEPHHVGTGGDGTWPYEYDALAYEGRIVSPDGEKGQLPRKSLPESEAGCVAFMLAGVLFFMPGLFPFGWLGSWILAYALNDWQWFQPGIAPVTWFMWGVAGFCGFIPILVVIFWGPDALMSAANVTYEGRTGPADVNPY